MRMMVILVVGGLIDLFAAKATVPLWREFHGLIVATPDYGMASANLALVLLDVVAFATFVIAIGPALVSMCLNYLLGPRRNQF